MAHGAPNPRNRPSVQVPAPGLQMYATQMAVRVPTEQNFPKPMLELVVEAGDLLVQIALPSKSLAKLAEGVPEAVAAAESAHTRANIAPDAGKIVGPNGAPIGG